MPTVQIRGASKSIQLDSNGDGIAKLGPESAREIWHPVNVHVSANIGSVTNEAQCSIYVGTGVEANNFRDATLSGSSGDTTDAVNSDELKSGDYIFAVWTGGDANVTATLAITGTKDI